MGHRPRGSECRTLAEVMLGWIRMVGIQELSENTFPARKFHGRDLLQHIVWWRISCSNVFVFRFCTNYTVDGSEFLQQLRLVVYPFFWQSFHTIPGGAGFLPSTVVWVISWRQRAFFHISDGSCDNVVVVTLNQHGNQIIFPPILGVWKIKNTHLIPHNTAFHNQRLIRTIYFCHSPCFTASNVCPYRCFPELSFKMIFYGFDPMGLVKITIFSPPKSREYLCPTEWMILWIPKLAAFYSGIN